MINPLYRFAMACMLCCFLAFSQSACSDKAKELYETAQFEEQQFNSGHATKLYREIVEKHPNSTYAQKAQERLAQLEKK